MFSWFGRQLKKRLYVWETRNFVETSGEILSTKHQPACPKCQVGRLKPSSDRMGARTCSNPACAAEFSLETLGETYAVRDVDVQSVVLQERTRARRLIYAAQATTVGAAGWAVWFDNWPTLIGGMVLALYLCLFAIVARYRAWQIEHQRMFERRAPFCDYLWQEFGLRKRS